jgi:hypothetical protein
LLSICLYTICAHINSLTSPRYIKVPVPIQESEQSCICARLLIWPLSTIFYWILDLFRQCGSFYLLDFGPRPGFPFRIIIWQSPSRGHFLYATWERVEQLWDWSPGNLQQYLTVFASYQLIESIYWPSYYHIHVCFVIHFVTLCNLFEVDVYMCRFSSFAHICIAFGDPNSNVGTGLIFH